MVSSVIQLALAPFTSLPGDVAVWWQAAERTMAGIGLYQRTGFSYPPLYGYWCMFLGGMAHLFGIHPSSLGGPDPSLLTSASLATPVIVTSPIFTLLLKLPLIAANLATGYFVWRIALRLGGNGRKARHQARTSFYWLVFNPFLIFESAVHGQIDALAACAIAAAVLCALDHRWLLAGIAVTLGISAKISPVFLIPPIIGFALCFPARRWRNSLSFIGGGLATGAVTLGGVTGAGLIENVFTRVGIGAGVGGVTLTGLNGLAPFRGIALSLLNHNQGVGQAVIVLTLAVAVAAGVWCFRQDSETSFVKACLVAMSATLVLNLVVNPQYLLWIAPFIALGAGGALGQRARWFRASSGMMAIGGVGYVVVLFGWRDLFAPSSAAFGWPSSASIKSLWATLASTSGPSWLPATLSLKLGLLSALFVLTGLGFMAAGLVGRSTNQRLSVSVSTDGRPRLRPNAPLAITAAVLCGVEAFGLLAPALASQPLVFASMSTSTTPNVTVTVDLKGAQSIRLAAFAVSNSDTINRVLVYRSPNRPFSGATDATVLGTFQELQAVLGKIPVDQIDAGGLQLALRQRSAAPRTMIVNVTGTLPELVWGIGRTGLLINWLKAGGILAVAGDVPGYYAVPPGPLTVSSGGHMVLNSKVQVLGRSALLPKGVVNGGDQWNAIPSGNQSQWATALGLSYNGEVIPISVNAVEGHGGTPLGLITASGTTSEAFVPLGKGGVLVFAGVDYPDLIASDIGRLALANWFNVASLPAVAGSSSRRHSFDFSLPRTAKGVEVVAFDINSQANWTWSKFLPWKR
jgi:hypothetical protein